MFSNQEEEVIIAWAHFILDWKEMLRNEKSLFYWIKEDWKLKVEISNGNYWERKKLHKRFDFSVIVWYEIYPNIADGSVKYAKKNNSTEKKNEKFDSNKVLFFNSEALKISRFA